MLDAGEAFEKMQLHTITAKDPDSLAYHAALRRTAARPSGGAGVARHGNSGAAAQMKQVTGRPATSVR